MSDISDWFERHNLDADTVQNIIAAVRADALVTQPFMALQPFVDAHRLTDLESRGRAFEAVVCPAMSSGFAEADAVKAALKTIRFAPLSDEATKIPYTRDAGAGQPPLVVMDWHRSPDDLICLAHEAAHAVQILLSHHEPMPPVARETCAFLGELLLLDHARQTDPTLFAALLQVWEQENTAYLGADLDALEAAVARAGTTYQYRLNYPLARLAAIELFHLGSAKPIAALFASGAVAMSHLALAGLVDRARDIANWLPPMPDDDAAQGVLQAYRRLGAVTLLDIAAGPGAAETSIGDYYAALRDHLREGRCLVALNDGRKPIGYSIWAPVAGPDRVTRQVAPFGDHLAVQRAVERRLGQANPAADPDRLDQPAEQLA